MTITSNHLVDVSCERNINALNEIRQRFNSFFSENGINYNIASQLELSIYEVLINVVDHEKESDTPIAIFVDIIDDSFICSISYEGSCFDLTKQELPTIDQHFAKGKKRGLGVYAIRKLMDEVKYDFKNNVSTVCLIKKLT